MLPPKCDIGQLHTPADTEYRLFRCHAALDHLHFKHILIHVEIAHTTHWIFAVQVGRNIRAAGAEKAVNRIYVLGYQFRVIGH